MFEQLGAPLTRLRQRVADLGASDDRAITEAEQVCREEAALAIRTAGVGDGAA